MRGRWDHLWVTNEFSTVWGLSVKSDGATYRCIDPRTEITVIGRHSKAFNFDTMVVLIFTMMQ